MESVKLSAADLIKLEDDYGAHNYHPLDVVVSKASGCWVWDVDGTKYLDFLAAYSAVNQGHAHPRIRKAMIEQSDRVTLTSRAFRSDQLGLLYKEMSELSGFRKMLPMNSGAEAVETAIKLARKWGYTVKGIPKDKAEILVFTGNFHGRTTTIISFSEEQQYKDGFGPLTPGFTMLPYGDLAAIEHWLEAGVARVVLGTLAARDPETGLPVNMNMMADAREPTLRTQAQSAAQSHLELGRALTVAELDAIEAFELQLYGAGHVGRAIARLLAGIDCSVQWIDERDAEFPVEASPLHIQRLCVEPVEAEVDAAPAGAFFLVLTHSHELDLRVTEAVLRRGDFAYLGLIGSATKRARFVHRFEQRGLLHVPVLWLGRTLHAVVAHFGLTHGGRLQQVQYLFNQLLVTLQVLRLLSLAV